MNKRTLEEKRFEMKNILLMILNAVLYVCYAFSQGALRMILLILASALLGYAWGNQK